MRMSVAELRQERPMISDAIDELIASADVPRTHPVPTRQWQTLTHCLETVFCTWNVCYHISSLLAVYGSDSVHTVWTIGPWRCPGGSG